MPLGFTLGVQILFRDWNALPLGGFLLHEGFSFCGLGRWCQFPEGPHLPSRYSPEHMHIHISFCFTSVHKNSQVLHKSDSRGSLLQYFQVHLVLLSIKHLRIFKPITNYFLWIYTCIHTYTYMYVSMHPSSYLYAIIFTYIVLSNRLIKINRIQNKSLFT